MIEGELLLIPRAINLAEVIERERFLKAVAFFLEDAQRFLCRLQRRLIVTGC
jgi:hypothetical protein